MDEVNRTLESFGRQILLEVRRWETDVYPGFHPEGPQGRIDEDLDIENCEILIGIFWKRFGSPVADAASGTEHEIRKALKAWQQGGHPQIMLYFCHRPYTLSTQEEVRQIQMVLAFEEEMKRHSLGRSYNSAYDFEQTLRQNLTQYSSKVLVDTEDSTIPGESEFHIQVSTAVSTVRPEGLTEALGEISLIPKMPTSEPAGLPKAVDVQVFIDVNLTNRLLAENLTDAVLVSRRAGGPPIAYLGRLLGANGVRFESVPLRDRADFEPWTFQILNLRGNANMKGWGGDRTPILVYVQIDGVTVRDPQQTIAEIGAGLMFEVLNVDGAVVRPREDAICLPQSLRQRRRVATLRYREGMPAAFKYRSHSPRQPNGALVDQVFVESALLGLPVRVEAGGYSTTGMADSGTQLVAAFHNVPGGLRLLVSRSEVRATSGLRAKLVQNGPRTLPEVIAPEESIEGIRAVQVDLGGMRTGAVAWEIEARDMPDPGLVEFAVYVEYGAQPDLNLPELEQRRSTVLWDHCRLRQRHRRTIRSRALPTQAADSTSSRSFGRGCGGR